LSEGSMVLPRTILRREVPY